MTDRELLEKAAKAAGLKGDWRLKHDAFWLYRENSKGVVEITANCWNPLTDDGDALRLAVKLNLQIGFDALPDGAVVAISFPYDTDFDEDYFILEWLNKDPIAATRRAIVRAAAILGEQDE